MAKIIITGHDKLYRDLFASIEGTNLSFALEDEYPSEMTAAQKQTIKSLGAGRFTVTVSGDGTPTIVVSNKVQCELVFQRPGEDSFIVLEKNFSSVDSARKHGEKLRKETHDLKYWIQDYDGETLAKSDNAPDED